MANVNTNELLNKAIEIIENGKNPFEEPKYRNVSEEIWKNEKCDDTFERISNVENYLLTKELDDALDRGNDHAIPQGNSVTVSVDSERKIEKNCIEISNHGSFIKGLAVSVNNNTMKAATVNIIPTNNGGFRYTGLDEDRRILDLGPVNTPVIVGDDISPCGLYVPFNDIDAVNQSIELLNAIRQSF